MIATALVRVSALQDGRLGRDLAGFQPTHVVSLLDPSLAPHRIPTFPSHVEVFQRSFFDVEDEVADGPAHQAVAELIGFLQTWSAAGPDARLLSHCHMGASRSTAAAYLALAVHLGSGSEAEAFEAFLGVANKPWPNLRMVALADQLLDRGGALIAPLETYRATYPRRIAAYYRLNAKRGVFR